jgi:phage shock protein E
MDWAIVVAGGVLLVVAFVAFAGSVPAGKAREFLRQGAKVIDVRSAEEFRAGHLPIAINIPLGELTESIGRHLPNKDDVVLLHCLSGGRSGIGTRLLKRLGYRKAYNLGSYRRAEQIVRSA